MATKKSSYQDHDDALLYCVQGYARLECQTSNLANEIGKIIVKYWNRTIKRYFEVLSSNKPHELPGDKNKNKKVNLKYFISDTFNTSKCVNCSNINCLEFKQSYEQRIQPKNHTKVSNIFKNIKGNEYQCKKCNHYILFNIKANIIYYDYDSYITQESTKYRYITPIRSGISNWKRIDKSGHGSCGESFNKNIQIIDKLKKKYSNQDQNVDYSYSIIYCNICDLFTYTQRNYFVDYERINRGDHR